MGFFPNFRVWNMLNTDTGQLIQGQFEPDSVSKNVGSIYAERFTLNRKKAILQFLHGKTPTVSFSGMLFNETILGSLPTFSDTRPTLETLQEWSQRDPLLGRPPVVTFWIGDSWLSIDAVIEDVDSDYLKPGFLGSFKGANFSVSLREYTPFDIEATAGFDTRFHPAKRGEYYELIAQREYREPLIGVILRQRNPSRINLQTGDVVRLPSGTGSIRQVPITQSSIVFSTAFEKQREPSPQRTRHQAMIAARNRTKVSHVLVA